ncbi:hypothetical protein R6Q59_006039 [Mikania micrantha]
MAFIKHSEHLRIPFQDIEGATKNFTTLIGKDHNWKAMISDLGLSKIGRANENDTFVITNACGTHGYCDPAYMDTGVLTKESYVYSFGVVLFEVLCGRLCFMNVNDERRFLAPLARRYYNKGKLHEIINPVMKEQLNPSSLNRISEIAYQCLLNDREKRPSMGVVAMRLKEALQLQEIDGLAMKREEINIISHHNPIVTSEVLSDPQKRPIYDQYGEEGLKVQVPPPGASGFSGGSIPATRMTSSQSFLGSLARLEDWEGSFQVMFMLDVLFAYHVSS